MNNLTDIVEPAVFTPFVKEKIIERSSLIQSGAVLSSEYLGTLASGGARTVSMPFWRNIDGESEVLSDTRPLTPTSITASMDVAAINYRAKSWGAKELLSTLAGSSAISAIASKIADFWIRDEQKMLVATLAGVFGSDEMQDHVYSGDGEEPLSAEMILDARQLLGDAYSQLHTIIMHSAAYTKLLKDDLLNAIIPSQYGAFATYLGLNVIVDDSVQYAQNENLFSAYLLADGAIGRGDGTPVDFTKNETWREPLKGEDFINYRQALILHPMGVKFTNEVCAGLSPTNEELANPLNWKRVVEGKSVGMIEIKHTI